MPKYLLSHCVFFPETLFGRISWGVVGLARILRVNFFYFFLANNSFVGIRITFSLPWQGICSFRRDETGHGHPGEEFFLANNSWRDLKEFFPCPGLAPATHSTPQQSFLPTFLPNVAKLQGFKWKLLYLTWQGCRQVLTVNGQRFF